MIQKDKYILAIDLGTNGPKAAIISHRGDIIGHDFTKNNVILLPGGGAEQDPTEWWKSIMDTCKKLLSMGLVPVDCIEAINCTTQWSGTVAIDKNGQHLMNAIIWLDTRGSKHIRKVMKGFPEISGYNLGKLAYWVKMTGGIPGLAGKDPLSHILYIKNEHPGVYNKTYKFLEPKDYINFLLTGKIGASYDSIILHWVTNNKNIKNIHYSKKLLKLTGIPEEKLPELFSTNEILGTITDNVAKELGLKKDVKVVIGTPDLHSAAVGSGAVQDYEGHLYIGTSSWLVCHVPYKKTDAFHNLGSIPSAIPGRYILANEQETATACIQHFLENVIFCSDEIGSIDIPEDIYTKIDIMVKKTPIGANNLIFTPWLYGERTPVEDYSVRSTFFNQSLETNRASMIRSIYEGVAFNTKWLLYYVEKFINKKMEVINIIGGGAKSDAWCQIFADILGRTIRRVKDPIFANLKGAGFLASVALGYISFDEIPKLIEIDKTFESNRNNHSIYKKLYDVFLSIYKNNQKIYSKLNKTL